ncbi:Cys-tRNA(Pro)/Cys-tRNA(Cys) deacylase ybaK [Solibacillus isronensis B3W22]|uniref:Cys-tRNA(Pro)/Cys-tRNA(Cys) deacylase n=1 Tax=Solibacillus isronensis B3W22 TaxID=1224748 RepID=K1L6I9_9BACL|nr:Cys-tRNA(Pro) deacylase [Solibacillus isronensis]AMO84201.1 aminoacyl-tRNA deacylase [Solibacillus silvestris]EKB46173.1 Cys-tRNA(Pro)/Cys-tRNA(Cys) deacylase ybaK [Solibacillus isronensis B3W22]
MAKKQAKTNAVRLIEQKKIAYEIFEYTINDGEAVDGLTVSGKIGQPVEHVYKTLVATAGKGNYFVFVIPVDAELNLKAAAKVVGQKKIEMLPVKELLGLTGYIRGGCSPIGMKKLFPTIIEEAATALDYIIVSAGKIGMQIKLAPEDLQQATNGQFASIVS